MGRGDLAGSAHLELVSGVAQLRPEDAMFEAMLRGWRAQQIARGLRADTIEARERLVRRFLEATNEYPWNWGPVHLEEWTMSLVGGAPLGAVDGPQLPGGPSRVQRVPNRPSLRLGSCLRGVLRPRRPPGGHLPRVEHHRPSERLRRQPRGAAVQRGKSCRPFWTTATSRWSERPARNARALLRHTGTPPSSRSCTGGACGAPRLPSSTSWTGARTLLQRSSGAMAC